MNRRDFLNLAGQGSLATWLGSFLGKYRANSTLNNSAPKETGTPQELDIDHRGRREVYESNQAASTVSASIVGFALAYPYMGKNLSKLATSHDVDAKLERVPRENKPDIFLDLNRLNQNHDRREFISQLGAGVTLAGLLGPAITYFSNPGGKVANLIHGEVKEGEDLIISRHREITADRQNLLSTLENSAAIGGLALLQRVTEEDSSLISSKCIVVGKDRLNNLLADGKNEVTFKCDHIESGENLIDFFPDSLRDENIRLEIQIQNESNRTSYVLDYDNKRGFYGKSISGTPKNIAIRLNYNDAVTIKRGKLGVS